MYISELRTEDVFISAVLVCSAH